MGEGGRGGDGGREKGFRIGQKKNGSLQESRHERKRKATLTKEMMDWT